MPLDDTNWPTIEVDETTALLIRARGLVNYGWCQRTVALTAKGHPTHPLSADAAKWCMFGSMFAAGVNWDNINQTYLNHPAVRRLQAAIGGEDICQFNNRQETVETVLAAFDAAIAAGDLAAFDRAIGEPSASQPEEP
jgi:hypothetical protein